MLVFVWRWLTTQLLNADQRKDFKCRNAFDACNATASNTWRCKVQSLQTTESRNESKRSERKTCLTKQEKRQKAPDSKRAARLSGNVWTVNTCRVWKLWKQTVRSRPSSVLIRVTTGTLKGESKRAKADRQTVGRRSDSRVYDMTSSTLQGRTALNTASRKNS